MRAFEIYLNGEKLCVAGLEQGDLLFSVSGGEDTRGRGGVGLGMTGLLPTKSTVRWHQRSLNMNDHVEVRIIEAKKADKFEVLQEPPRDSRKYEKAYVRRMAKEFGWTIQIESKGRRKTSTGE